MREIRGDGQRTRRPEKGPLAFRSRGDAEVYHLVHFEITWEAMEDDHVKRLPESVRKRMDVLHSTMHRDPAAAEKEIRQLVVKYPDVVCFRNWLCASLRHLGRPDEAREICIALFSDHPDYFFARTTLAELALDANDIETAERLLTGDGVALTTLYPGRKVFHISEVRHWFFVCGKLQLLKGNVEGARAHRDLLAKVEPNSLAVQELDRLMAPKNVGMLQILGALRRLKDFVGASRKRLPARRSSHLSSNASIGQPDLFPDT